MKTKKSYKKYEFMYRNMYMTRQLIFCADHEETHVQRFYFIMSQATVEHNTTNGPTQPKHSVHERAAANKHDRFSNKDNNVNIIIVASDFSPSSLSLLLFFLWSFC